MPVTSADTTTTNRLRYAERVIWDAPLVHDTVPMLLKERKGRGDGGKGGWREREGGKTGREGKGGDDEKKNRRKKTELNKKD